MRRLILQEFSSVDGFAAASDGNVDFIPAASSGDHSFGQRQLDFMDSIDAILLGRVTYEMFAGYWPDATSGEDRELAEKINATPKIVFSKTLGRAPWGRWPEATIVRGSAAAEVARLKKQPGKDMVIWGSLSLAQSLLAEGMVDQVQLIICPVVLGSGKHLFADAGDQPAMSLIDTRSFDRGNVLLSYDTSGARVGGERGREIAAAR